MYIVFSLCTMQFFANVVNFIYHFCKDIELNLRLMTVDFFNKAKTVHLLGYLAPSQSAIT